MSDPTRTLAEVSAGPVRAHHVGVMPFFVYGTLMHSSGAADRWIDQVDRIERNLIVTGYSLYVTHGSFPYALEVPDPDTYVFGELLWPKSDYAAGVLTRRFDAIEGHPDFYVRTMVEITRSRTSTQTAWMYVLPTEHKIPGTTYMPIGSSWRMWVRDNPDAIRGAGPLWRGTALI